MKRLESLQRSEVRRVADAARESMDDAEKAAGTAADDHDVAVNTLEALSGAMTDEGAESVQDGLDGAEGAAEDDFADHDAELDRLQDDADDRAAELDDHGDSVEFDVARIRDAAGEVALHEVRDHLDRTAEASQEDVDFLSEAAEQERANREASERVQAALEARIARGG